MRSFATLLLVVAAGCTAHNPDFVGAAGGGDLAGAPPADLAGLVLDLAGPLGACTAGQRMCSGTTASDRCEGGMFVVDRSCPMGSECKSNFCAAPSPVFGTQIGQRCDANGGAQQLQCMASAQVLLSCQPFVEGGKNLRWFCDAAVGNGRAGLHCARGSECRSGICGGNGTCFDACQRDQDCMLVAATLTCQSIDIVVEGVKATVKGCAP